MPKTIYDSNAPDVNTDYGIFNDLGLPENVRRELQSDLIQKFHKTGKDQTASFFAILNKYGITPVFPRDLVDLLGPQNNSLEKTATVYVKHEWALISSELTLQSFPDIGVSRVKISTCGDIRVCKQCEKVGKKASYPVDKAPRLPLCWQCRCVYLPIFDGMPNPYSKSKASKTKAAKEEPKKSLLSRLMNPSK